MKQLKNQKRTKFFLDIFKRFLKENSSKIYLNISTEQKENKIENRQKEEQIGKKTEKEETINNPKKDTINPEPTQINDLKKLIQEQNILYFLKKKA